MVRPDRADRGPRDGPGVAVPSYRRFGVPRSCGAKNLWSAEDLPAARELVATIEGAELFLYPGDRHLFADNSLPDYDEGAAKLLKQRVVSFLDNIE